MQRVGGGGETHGPIYSSHAQLLTGLCAPAHQGSMYGVAWLATVTRPRLPQNLARPYLLLFRLVGSWGEDGASALKGSWCSPNWAFVSLNELAGPGVGLPISQLMQTRDQ